MAPISSAVASWELGLRLIEGRKETGLNGTDAAKEAGVTGAFLSEVERGKKNIAEDRLNMLIKIYSIVEEEAEELRTLRMQAGGRGWWTGYSALFSDQLLRFFGYEYGAETLQTFDSSVVNGLLQTEDYARAIIEAGSPNIRLAEAERRVKCRMLRQRRLTDDDPIQFSTVMSEAVLRQQVGGPEVLKGQLEHIVTLVDDLPNTLEVRVVPFEAAGHDALGGSAFHLMSFSSGKLPTVIWQETVTSTQLITDPVTVREYDIALAGAAKVALGREESLELIKKASGQL